MSPRREGSYIRFVGDHVTKSGRTAVFNVLTREGGAVIGEVRWYWSWRKYAFFPRPETVFEQVCLHEIAKFCEDETRRHRAKGGPVGEHSRSDSDAGVLHPIRRPASELSDPARLAGREAGAQG